MTGLFPVVCVGGEGGNSLYKVKRGMWQKFGNISWAKLYKDGYVSWTFLEIKYIHLGHGF